MSYSRILTNLDSYKTPIKDALTSLEEKRIPSRIWDQDHLIWKPEPTEITNRLGWLDIAERLQGDIPRITRLKYQLENEGYTQALLLGMGGSSLAPEVFAKIFGDSVNGLSLSILDSTDPEAVLGYTKELKLKNTIFIVSTKSGGTVETLSFFKFFYNRVLAEIGKEAAGAHFIAITDPGSKLETLAKELNFREIFLNDPNIGGRFSAMSFFGLVPAGLVGLDLYKLTKRATRMAQECGKGVPVDHNPGAILGAVLGSLNKYGRDKVTFVISPGVASFGDWVEQLIAESTGKEGKGILPVIGETLLSSDMYGNDRLFVNLYLRNEDHQKPALMDLANSGHPVLHLPLEDEYDIGAQFFLWEFATTVAGYFLMINPFNQPNVESAKIQARKMVATYEKTGKLPEIESAPINRESLQRFLEDRKLGDYICLQAYVNPTKSAKKALSKIRLDLLRKYKLATTAGFGPRFLHSTGQLHKGDAGNGIFIQIISSPVEDVGIPQKPGDDTSHITFQTLKLSQALGDAAALQSTGRKLILYIINDIEEVKQLT
jgi:glucose-6-phosphate isomerase